MSQQVIQVCRRLGIHPPNYILLPQPDGEDVWNGYARFNDRIVPSDVGIVSGVYTEQFAKERVAEEALKWLLTEERRRKKLAEEFHAQHL